MDINAANSIEVDQDLLNLLQEKNGSNYTNVYSESDPLKISNAAQLAAFAKAVNSGRTFEGEYVKREDSNSLDKKINLNGKGLNILYEGGKVSVSSDSSGVKNVWDPIGNSGSFNGTFDGNGYEIDSMVCYSTNGTIGFFGTIGSKANVKNWGIGSNCYSILKGSGSTLTVNKVLSGGEIISESPIPDFNSNILTGYSSLVPRGANVLNVLGKKESGGIVPGRLYLDDPKSMCGTVIDDDSSREYVANLNSVDPVIEAIYSVKHRSYSSGSDGLINISQIFSDGFLGILSEYSFSMYSETSWETEKGSKVFDNISNGTYNVRIGIKKSNGKVETKWEKMFYFQLIAKI